MCESSILGLFCEFMPTSLKTLRKIEGMPQFFSYYKIKDFAINTVEVDIIYKLLEIEKANMPWKLNGFVR